MKKAILFIALAAMLFLVGCAPSGSVETKPVARRSYEEILADYSQKLRAATPGLIAEYNEAAKMNQDGLTGLATLSNEKVGELAEILNEGTQEMAEIYLYEGSGSYDEYSEWAEKLYEVYAEEADKIWDVYMDSAI